MKSQIPKEKSFSFKGENFQTQLQQGQRFQIKTDHQSLKYFMEQRISSLEQQKWVTKLFGYDYEIIYKKGKDNVVVDALS